MLCNTSFLSYLFTRKGWDGKLPAVGHSSLSASIWWLFVCSVYGFVKNTLHIFPIIDMDGDTPYHTLISKSEEATDCWIIERNNWSRGCSTQGHVCTGGRLTGQGAVKRKMRRLRLIWKWIPSQDYQLGMYQCVCSVNISYISNAHNNPNTLS